MISCIAMGQTLKPNLPTDSVTGKVSYTAIVRVDSLASQEQLYKVFKVWAATAYNSVTNVIKYDDQSEGKVIIKAQTPVVSLTGFDDGAIAYTFTFQSKQGRYRYEITDLYHKGTYRAGFTIPDYGTAEQLLAEPRKLYQKTFFYYLEQADAKIKSLVASLIGAMNMAPTNKKDDW